MSKVRTRFAPSPTGFMHVGGLRTALFAWLVAKQASGQFILRVEDTDKTREVAGSEQHIQDSLRWIGIDWDEGTDIGGSYAPYRQSERLETYKKWALKLVEKGRAYADPYSPEELESFRQKALAEKRPFLFRDHRPESAGQQTPKWDGTKPLRLKSDPKSYSWHDAVLGDLKTGPEVIDDFILIKSDGYPTYNFCHIIDDHLMEITHVIRSQEFISSVPKYLNLYEALDIKPPIMATLPYVMAIDGKKKLGKRDGAKDILDYARDGYLPEAMMNFLATLGWNDGTEQEIFSKEELISKFDLSRVQRAGARFDEQRLLWMNGQWIRKIKLDDLFDRTKNYWPQSAKKHSDDYKKRVLDLVQERLKILSELPILSEFFFSEPKPDINLVTKNSQLSKIDKADLKQLLITSQNALQTSDFSKDSLTKILNDLLESTNQKPAILFSLIRIATTWAPASPELTGSLSVLGKKQTLDRIQKAIDFLS
jgi:glutamyl-tRNA synthetase